MEVKFAYDMNQIVAINETGGAGKVIGNYFDRDGIISVHVWYADKSGVVQSGYFREHEIRAA